MKTTQIERDLVDDGRNVQFLYDAYIEPYFEKTKDRLLSEYQRLQSADTAGMVDINMQLRALNGLSVVLRKQISKGKAIEKKFDEREALENGGR